MTDALVYTSRASESLTNAELEVVLLRSRVLNASRGLTGALLKQGDAIVQYLEGETAALERTYAAIARSPLHSDLRVHARATGVPRVFATWHMAFHDFQARHDRDQATALWRTVAPGAGADAAPANPAIEYLLQCWREFDAGQ